MTSLQLDFGKDMDSDLSDAESVGSVPPWASEGERTDFHDDLTTRMLLAKWNRHCVDFTDEELRDHYTEMSEEERLLRWTGVKALAKEELRLVTAGIPSSTIRNVVSVWREILLSHEEDTKPRLHRSVKIPRARKSATSKENDTATATAQSVMGMTQQLEDRLKELGGAIKWKEVRAAKGFMELYEILHETHPELSLEDVQLMAESVGAKALAEPIFNETQARRRTTVAKKSKVRVEENSEEESEEEARPAKRVLSATERFDRFPRLDTDIDVDYPIEERKTVIEVLEIGLTITKGDPRRKKEFVATAGYRRHREAPYAYTYYGNLRRCYYSFVKRTYETGDKVGQRIWPDALIAKLCEGYNAYHEEHPNVVNAAGSLYRRLPPSIKPCRDMAGKYRSRAVGEAPILTHFGKTNAIAAAIKDEDNLINIKEFTAADVGLRRITKQDEATLKPVLNASVEQERYLGLQKGMIPLVRRMVDQETARIVAEAAADRSDAEQRVESLREENEELADELVEVVSREMALTSRLAKVEGDLELANNKVMRLQEMVKMGFAAPVKDYPVIKRRLSLGGEGEEIRKKKFVRDET